MDKIEICRALTVAANSLRYNPKLSTIEIQAHEETLCKLRDSMDVDCGANMFVEDDTKPLESPIFSKRCFSRMISWNHPVEPIPELDIVNTIVCKARQGSVEAAKQIVAWKMCCRMSKTADEGHAMEVICQAMQELFE